MIYQQQYKCVLVSTFYTFSIVLILSRIVYYATFAHAEITLEGGFLLGDYMDNAAWASMVNIGFFQCTSMLQF